MIYLTFRFDDPFVTSDHARKYGIFAAAETASTPLNVAVISFRRQEGGNPPSYLTRPPHTALKPLPCCS